MIGRLAFALVLLLAYNSNAMAVTAACREAVAEEGGGFQSLSAQLAGDTTLVSSELFAGFAPISDAYSSSFLSIPRPRAVGIRATAAVPALTATLSEYANAALQLRDGALFGVAFSPVGSPYWPWYYEPRCKKDGVEATELVAPSGWVRGWKPDRVYLWPAPVPPLTRAYFTHGLGLKVLRAGLQDSEEDKGTQIEPYGTYYVGLGFDGPVEVFTPKGALTTIAGTLDFQAGYQVTWVSDATLRKLYDDEAINSRRVEGVFARLKLLVTDQFFVDVEYVAPLAGAKMFMDEVTTFSIGYSLQKPQAAGKLANQSTDTKGAVQVTPPEAPKKAAQDPSS